MRRLRVDKTRTEDNERGAVSILMAFLMVALLGFTAIAVDVGVLYAERAQLQNGADAAALALAQDCAKGASSASCTESSSIPETFADGNALDGATNIQDVELNHVGQKLTVTTGALEPGTAPNSVSLFFANILGIPTAEVGAQATTAWGSPVSGQTPFPLTFSICQVENGKVGGGPQLLQSHGSNTCTYGSSGQTAPGGYGWLVQDSGQCGGTIDIALAEGGGDAGNEGPANCDATLNKWATEITAGRDVVVLLPIFNKVTGTGSGASYNMVTFAAFKVLGWKFSGGNSLPMVFKNASGSLTCTGDCRGIIGEFIKYVSLDSGYELGPLSPYGAAVVKMEA